MLMSISPSIINSPIDIIFIIKWMIGIDINSIRFFIILVVVFFISHFAHAKYNATKGFSVTSNILVGSP